MFPEEEEEEEEGGLLSVMRNTDLDCLLPLTHSCIAAPSASATNDATPIYDDF